MSNSNDPTPQIAANSLRVDDLMPKIAPYLSDRARHIFKNVRTSLSEECFFYGRIVREVTPEASADFANRLNKLFDTFNGHNDYYCFGKQIQPRVTSCLAVPMSIPLFPEGKRRCKICNADMVGIICSGGGNPRHEISAECVIENPVPRIMFLTYVFVEGLDLTVLQNSWENARLWLNTITRSFIHASREGELPVNTKD